MTVIIHNKQGKPYQMAEVAKLCERKYAAIAKWHNCMNFKFVEDYVAYAKRAKQGYLETPKQKEARIRKGLESKAILTIPDELIDFPRKIICQRNLKNHKECRHYSSCANSRVFNQEHHERFKDDGSCYDEVPLLTIRRNGPIYKLNI